MKKWSVCLLLAVAMTAFGWSIASAAPVVNGSFNITFYSEPNHTATATLCMTFVRTGTILSEPQSGTWSSPQLGGGEWIQEGDYFKWYGPQLSQIIMTSGFGHYYVQGQAAGEFVTFRSDTGSTSNAGSWKMVRTQSCTVSASPLTAPELDLTK